MTKSSETSSPSSQARFVTGSHVFGRWREDVTTGKGPVLYQHAFPFPEIGPGLVTLIGGAPGGGKTALTCMMGIEMLRFQPELRLLMANCEMSPEALLNRQLARLSGVDAEVVRYRRFGPEHDVPVATGLATLGAVIDRMAFMSPPYDIANVFHTGDAFGADVVIVDYIQRFADPKEDVEARHRVNRTMDYLRKCADMGVAVIVVSAVGRTRDKAGRSSYTGDGLSLASFRETSELEYGADDALILSPFDDDDPDLIRLSHLKARHGRQVTQEFRFDRSVQSFHLLAGAAVSTPREPSYARTSGVGGGGASISDSLRRLWDSHPLATEASDAEQEGGIDG